MVEQSKLAVLNQTVLELAAATAFATQEVWRDIYTVPRISWLSSGNNLELQVASGGDEVVDRAGSVRRTQLRIIIGILTRTRKDYAGRHFEALKHETESIFKYESEIISILDGCFLGIEVRGEELKQPLLVRPLINTGTSIVSGNANFPGLLIKEVYFIGGLNVEL